MVTCALCGIVFQRARAKAGRSKSGLDFCTIVCRAKAQRIGGLPGVIPAHYGSAHINYRIAALRAHGSKCSSCGYRARAKMLDVHHKNGDRADNTIDNLEVLCVWCHALITRRVPLDAFTVRSYRGSHEADRRPVAGPRKSKIDPYVLAVVGYFETGLHNGFVSERRDG
jgi:hypothetical protein